MNFAHQRQASACIANAHSQTRKGKPIIHDILAQVQSRTATPPSRTKAAKLVCKGKSNFSNMLARHRIRTAVPQRTLPRRADLRMRRKCAQHYGFHIDLALLRGLAKKALSPMRFAALPRKRFRPCGCTRLLRSMFPMAMCFSSRKLLDTVGNRLGTVWKQSAKHWKP